MTIGNKLKNLRNLCGLTQEELADRCDLTKGYISQLENDITSPSISTLTDILSALGSNLKNFFSDEEDNEIVFKKEDYFVKDVDKYIMTWLVPNSQKNEMEPILFELPANESSDIDMPHEGEEFGYVLDGTIVPGQDYFVRIKYSIGSIDNQYLKYGVVHGHTGMDTSAFYKALYESLEANFKREAESPVKIVPVTTGSGDSLQYTGVKIVEVEPKWVLGTYPQRPADIEVSVDTIEVDGMEKPWGEAKLGGVTASDYAVKYPNSKKIADLEWFTMGERGDQYKNYGWPNVIPVEYMVNANSTAGYDSLNIHYAYTGTNESVQKSEKDLFIVAEGSTEVISNLAAGVSNLLKGKKFDGSDLES